VVVACRRVRDDTQPCSLPPKHGPYRHSVGVRHMQERVVVRCSRMQDDPSIGTRLIDDDMLSL